MDEVAGGALARQLGGDRGVQHHGEPGATAGAHVELAGLQRPRADLEPFALPLELNRAEQPRIWRVRPVLGAADAEVRVTSVWAKASRSPW